MVDQWACIPDGMMRKFFVRPWRIPCPASLNLPVKSDPFRASWFQAEQTRSFAHWFKSFARHDCTDFSTLPIRHAFPAASVEIAHFRSFIAQATIELWLASREGDYDDQHRATVVSNETGEYRFESNRPPSYGFRPPHIHIRITAEGFKPLVAQHYPEEGASQARFDIVLRPQ